MEKEFAVRLMARKEEHRWVDAKTPRGVTVSGLMVSLSGEMATIKRDDKRGKDFLCDLKDVMYR